MNFSFLDDYVKYVCIIEGGEVERIPLLFVDVNIGKDRQERITIYTGDSAENLAKEFALSHSKNQILYFIWK